METENKTKKCNSCNFEKKITNFYYRKDRNKHESKCNECKAENARINYKKNPNKQKKANKKYMNTLPKEVMENKRIKAKKYRKEYYKNNKEEVLKYNKAWRRNNPEWQREYESKRMKEDLNFRITRNLRSRMSMAIRKQCAIKENTKLLLGCDIDFLKKHLESTFDKNMNWGNYGKWHIDHIIPCSKFDLTKKPEQEKCFHYTNLQALWEKDNLSKGGRIQKKQTI